MTDCSRRELLYRGALLGGGAIAAAPIAGGFFDAAGASEPTAPRPTTPQAALAQLLAGNRRFASGKVRNPRRDGVRRVETAAGQEPFAMVLTCADSRVPAEIVFDQGIGDIFVVRVAGNTAEDAVVVGSLEYAVVTFESLVLFVLGHDECGAVKAAIDVTTKGTSLPGDLPAVVAPILPVVRSVQNVPKDELLDAATLANVHQSVQQLSASPLLAAAIAKGDLLVTGGEYQLHTGKIKMVEPT